MATGVNTVILFLRKVKNKKEDILYFLEKSINDKKDNSINEIEKPINIVIKFVKVFFCRYLCIPSFAIWVSFSFRRDWGGVRFFRGERTIDNKVREGRGGGYWMA